MAPQWWIEAWENMFPQAYLKRSQFKALVKVTAEAFWLSNQQTACFPQELQLNTAPTKFLKYICSIVGYEYEDIYLREGETEQEREQRERSLNLKKFRKYLVDLREKGSIRLLSEHCNNNLIMALDILVDCGRITKEEYEIHRAQVEGEIYKYQNRISVNELGYTEGVMSLSRSQFPASLKDRTIMGHPTNPPEPNKECNLDYIARYLGIRAQYPELTPEQLLFLDIEKVRPAGIVFNLVVEYVAEGFIYDYREGDVYPTKFPPNWDIIKNQLGYRAISQLGKYDDSPYTVKYYDDVKRYPVPDVRIHVQMQDIEYPLEATEQHYEYKESLSEDIRKADLDGKSKIGGRKL